MVERGNPSRGSQAQRISLFPRCSIVGTYQCSQRVFTHCIRCGRAVCLFHIEGVKGQDCLLNASPCLVCLYPERYPRDPQVGRWRPYHKYRPGIPRTEACCNLSRSQKREGGAIVELLIRKLSLPYPLLPY